jgi:hypothetical protein
MKRHWSLPNMLAMCDTCLSELMKDLKGERYDAALDKAERMKKRIMRLKVHCRDCDERIVDEI